MSNFAKYSLKMQKSIRNDSNKVLHISVVYRFECGDECSRAVQARS